jgi:Fungal specific transcription factor domain
LFDLEKEAFELRQRLETQTVWGNGLPPTPTTSNMDPSITMTPIMSNSSTSPPAHINSMVSPPAEPHEIVATPTSPAGTQSRSLDGVLVSATEIDELFQVYFQDLHQFLPILDSKHTPNHYYDKSPLLFWAVLAVASRTYSKDPTLLDSLGERVLNLGLLSLRTPTVTNIKGLLLILTWPLAKAAGADTTYAISGTILHMAMQIGLHIPTSSQDFSRVKVNLTETQIIKRAELWGYCIVTYQRSCSFKGYSPLALMETYQDSEQRHTLFQRISQSLRLQLRLNGVLTRCQSAILQNGLRVMSKDQEHALEILIRVFEATLKDVEPDAISGKFIE